MSAWTFGITFWGFMNVSLSIFGLSPIVYVLLQEYVPTIFDALHSRNFNRLYAQGKSAGWYPRRPIRTGRRRVRREGV